eukprot:4847726-Amphidinium_carterae.1
MTHTHTRCYALIVCRRGFSTYPLTYHLANWGWHLRSSRSMGSGLIQDGSMRLILHADVMAAKGDHHVDEHRVQATPSLRQGNPVEYLKDRRAEPARPVMT